MHSKSISISLSADAAVSAYLIVCGIIIFFGLSIEIWVCSELGWTVEKSLVQCFILGPNPVRC